MAPSTTYAKGTVVPVAKSQTEILAALREAGADDIGMVERKAAGTTLVTFALKDQRFQLAVPIPKVGDFKATQGRLGHRDGGYRMSSGRSAEDNRAQAEREIWRLFVLAVKAKFALIAAGISTAETEFMAAIVLPGGGTVGETVQQELRILRDGGRSNGALLLGMGSRSES